jgi:hypothetical protein
MKGAGKPARNAEAEDLQPLTIREEEQRIKNMPDKVNLRI